MRTLNPEPGLLNPVALAGYKTVADFLAKSAFFAITVLAARLLTREAFGMSTKLRVTSGPEGWSVLGAGPWVTGFGNDALVHRYDDDGECEGADDRLFVDGFDGAG